MIYRCRGSICCATTTRSLTPSPRKMSEGSRSKYFGRRSKRQLARFVMSASDPKRTQWLGITEQSQRRMDGNSR
jgi:hypothetical protein